MMTAELSQFHYVAVVFSRPKKLAALNCNYSLNRCDYSCPRKQSVFISEPHKSQEDLFSPCLGEIFPEAVFFLASVSRAALAYEDEWVLLRLVQLSLQPWVSLPRLNKQKM